ncbi:MAG: hypothetical protein DMG80_18760 [Acidobacteria bacterium]|nr:MAG: hypothetical protein DMG80_18760 [Acidobacteriota bacterium]
MRTRVFFCGGPSIAELLRRTREPEVLFSPIKSPPRRSDVLPQGIAVWTRAECLDGAPFQLPKRTLVTSRQDEAKAKAAHYALVCHSSVPLNEAGAEEPVSINALQNLISGRSVGASQVTAVVALRDEVSGPGLDYAIALRARLVWPYFLRLSEPVPAEKGESFRGWDSIVRVGWKGVLDFGLWSGIGPKPDVSGGRNLTL